MYTDTLGHTRIVVDRFGVGLSYHDLARRSAYRLALAVADIAALKPCAGAVRLVEAQAWGACAFALFVLDRVRRTEPTEPPCTTS